MLATGRNASSRWWDGPMVRNSVYCRNTVIGYGGFGLSDKTTDVILEDCRVVNSTVGIHVNASTSNVVQHRNSVT